jgi:hypothetical protein
MLRLLSAAFQGLCNLQMGRLLLELQSNYPDAAQHEGHKSVGYRHLLAHLMGSEWYTADWVTDWVAASYGVDGLPSEWFTEESIARGCPEIDDSEDNELPANLLKYVVKRNEQRWMQSRLTVSRCLSWCSYWFSGSVSA